MKTAGIFLAACLAIASTEAIAIAPIPKEHHARFLQEREALEDELDAWKSSPAGRLAKKNGYYKEDPHESTAATDDQLSRMFLSKLSIKKAQKENPNATFSLNSPFTLMTEAEFAHFVKRSSGDISLYPHATNTTTTASHRGLRALATSIDWTTGKCVAPVKDQQYCGGCWAFSSISALESAICLKTGKLTELSEQQLVSCDSNDSGCEGGLITTGLSYLQSQGSVSTEASYPFTSGETEEDGTCTTRGHTKVSFSIATVQSVPATESAFIAAISKQPVGVAIAASSEVFKQYSGGVLSACSTTELDHAVTAVGYDSVSFKIRNSWGAEWGENGYVRLQRQGAKKAACNLINTYAAYPVLA
jgi:cathepsin L